MASPIRLSEELVKQAEQQGKSNFRSAPKQIELWASIGQEVEHLMTPADLAALVNGEIEVRIFRKKSAPVSMDEVFAGIEDDRQKGLLSAKVVKDEVWYEESSEHPGYLVRVSSGGRDIGVFKNGSFNVVNPESIKRASGGRR